jgi:hypothetical protein
MAEIKNSINILSTQSMIIFIFFIQLNFEEVKLSDQDTNDYNRSELGILGLLFEYDLIQIDFNDSEISSDQVHIVEIIPSYAGMKHDSTLSSAFTGEGCSSSMYSCRRRTAERFQYLIRCNEVS